MVHQVIVPKLGTNIEDGLIVEWKAMEGDHVKKGDTLLLVETSKAIFEVEAEANGFLRRILFKEDSEVRLTEPVALLSDTIDEPIEGFSLIEPAPGRFPAKKHHERKRDELLHTPTPPSGPGREQRAKNTPRAPATPAARRVARELSLDVEKIAEAAGVSVVDESVVRGFIDKRKVAIYGAGLGVKQIKEIILHDGNSMVVGLIDDNASIKGMEIAGYRVLGGWDDLLSLAESGFIDGVVVSLHSEFRRKVTEKLRKELPCIELPPIVDSRSVISTGVTISPGVLVEAGSVIGPDTFIGEGAIVDLGAIVSHDCHIGPHSHLSPGCTLSGLVRLEENVLVGVGAAVNSQVTVGRNVVITPGSAVVNDLPDDVVVSGNPAKIIGKSLRGK